MLWEIQRKRSHLTGAGWWLILFALTGCAIDNSPSLPDYASCAPEGGNASIYQAGMFEETRDIVDQSLAFSGIMPTFSAATSGGNSIGAVPNGEIPANLNMTPQYAAFLFLREEIIHASDRRTIKFDNLNEVNIIVTFLSPKLLQAVFLNEFLYASGSLTDFESRMFAALDKPIRRQELLFMVTIIGMHRDPLADPHLVEIPEKRLILTNASNRSIKPGHEEHNITQPYHTNQDPESGIIGYPIRILVNGECTWALDPIYDTNIVIGTDDIKVDKSTYEPMMWSIPYASLMDPGHSAAPSNPDAAAPGVIAPIASPPRDTSLNSFWSEYALFVWSKVLEGNN